MRYLQERENKLWRKKNQAHHPSGERDVVLKTKDALEQRISSYQPFTHEEQQPHDRVPEGRGTDRPAGTGTDGCRKRGMIQEPAEAVHDSSHARLCLQQDTST